MKKPLYLLLSFTLLLLASCKELMRDVPPTGGGSLATDTTYIAAVEKKQDRVVVIEEFTGVSCSPCPNGHAIVNQLQALYPNRFAILGIQPFGIITATPLTENGDVLTRQDNRNQEGTDIASSLGGLGGTIPQALIDRQLINGSYFCNVGSWSFTATGRLATATPLNIAIASSVSKNLATIQVKISFTEAVTTRQYLVVALTEDSIIDAQKNGLSIDTNYVHLHVLRDIITTGTPGASFLTDRTSIEAGRVYEKTFSYNLSAAWNPAHCHIIAYVVKNETGNKEVEQAAMAHLQ